MKEGKSPKENPWPRRHIGFGDFLFHEGNESNLKLAKAAEENYKGGLRVLCGFAMKGFSMGIPDEKT
jgi:hypothetical protein